MEIKIPGVMPLWLSHALSANKIYRTSFSKIGACYKQFILSEQFPDSHTVPSYQRVFIPENLSKKVVRSYV